MASDISSDRLRFLLSYYFILKYYVKHPVLCLLELTIKYLLRIPFPIAHFVLFEFDGPFCSNALYLFKPENKFISVSYIKALA